MIFFFFVQNRNAEQVGECSFSRPPGLFFNIGYAAHSRIVCPISIYSRIKKNHSRIVVDHNNAHADDNADDDNDNFVEYIITIYKISLHK